MEHIRTEASSKRSTSFSFTDLAKQHSLKIQSLVAYALLILQPFAFFRSVVFSKTRHIPFDIEGWHQPIAAFLARSARAHLWPSWNPYNGCGAPAYADLQAQMFYPITWVALLASNLSDGRKLFFWLETLVPLHMCIGGMFLYLFIRGLGTSIPVSLIGATIYELGAFFASQAQHLGAVSCAAFFPLLLLCALKLSRRTSARWIGIAGIASALLILAGFPQTAIVAFALTYFFLFALMVIRMGSLQGVLALTAGVMLGLCISTAQLVPTLEAVPITIAKLRGDWHLTGGGLPLQSLASFVWPNYYHLFEPWGPKYKLPFDFTFLYTYCGHTAVILLACVPFILLSRRRRTEYKLLLVSSLFVLISVVWMLGDGTPVYRWIYAQLPRPLRGSLYSEYALMGFSLWVGVTSALALEYVTFKRKIAISWLLATLAAANLIAVSSNRAMNAQQGGYKSASSERTISGDPRLVDVMRRLTRAVSPPLRVELLAPHFFGLTSGAEMYRIPAATADDPFNVLRYYHFRLSLTGNHFWDRVQPLTSTSSRWIDAINDGYILARPNLSVTPDRRLEPMAIEGAKAWRNRSVLPRFYLVDRVQSVPNAEDARALLPRIADPATEAIVEGLGRNWQGSGAKSGSVRVVKYEDSHVELAVKTSAPSYLVTSETFYPGWQATANGKPVDLLPTNLAFRGMAVQAGVTNISMTFQVNHLAASIAFSLVSLLVTLALIALPRRTWQSLLHQV